jgi:hypothetical protein
MTGESQLRAWLESLPKEALARLARDYAERARADGAYVITPDARTVPIPPILTPLGIPRAKMKEVSADSHALISALVRLTADLMMDESQEPLRERLFGAFGPLERTALVGGWAQAEKLATVRVDFLVDEHGQHRALEVNATIPAMQGYSDAIAAAFLRAVAAARGRGDGERLIDQNGRNTDDLLASLIAHFADRTGRQPQSIAIVAREGDAQRGELEHYVRRWSALGLEVVLTTPADVHIISAAPGSRGIAGDFAPDLFYRHIFARRLDPDSDFARMCLGADQFQVLNPIASHLEVKAMLGLLSAAIGQPAAARMHLSDEEQSAVARTVPWTRLYQPGATTGPDGARIDDLGAWVAAHGDALVLKRSWDYGGKGVFLGADLDSPSTQQRVRALIGHDGSWTELCAHALADRDAWVVQELVRAQPVRHLRVGDDGIEAKDLYVDLSAFTNLGVAARPSGGAVRAAESRIVNILGGGGLAPLIADELLQAIFSPS